MLFRGSVSCVRQRSTSSITSPLGRADRKNGGKRDEQEKEVEEEVEAEGSPVEEAGYEAPDLYVERCLLLLIHLIRAADRSKRNGRIKEKNDDAPAHCQSHSST